MMGFLRFLPAAVVGIFSLLVLLRFLSPHGQETSPFPDIMTGRVAPPTILPQLTFDNNENGTLDLQSRQPRVTLVNFWASWCAPCREEHPFLMQLAREPDLDLIGINYKDNETNARAFLTALGNPFKLIGVDVKGRTAIDWGVYGVPETYLIDGNGLILYRHIGPINEEAFHKTLLPEIARAIRNP